MKFKAKVLSSLLIFGISSFSFVNAASIDNIGVLNSNNLDVTFTQDVSLSSEFGFDGEIKVFKDIDISFASKDLDDSNKVSISLNEEISPNTSYNLIGIFGADGNIDFEVGEVVSGYEKTQHVSEGQGIISVSIEDPTNLSVIFNNELTSDEFEFKLLGELSLDNISVSSENSAAIKTITSLEKLSDYIMVVISMRDATGSDVNFDEDLYNFSTPVNLDSGNESEQIKSGFEEEFNDELGDVALNAAETPDTGAETWVLIALTIMVQLGFIARKKIFKS